MTNRKPDLPVFFLAFSNDRSNDGRYLRNLPEELRQIKAELDQAKSQDLCDYVYLPNATLAEILDTFTKTEYRNRIAVFHYAGHADAFRLLLETKDGRVASADAAGFASFLTTQLGLKLVFLNACSTQPQVEGLLDANIPMVIATSQAIKDEVAKEFATYFYRGLARGINVRAAYKEAEAAIRAQGDWNIKKFFWEKAQAALDTIQEDRLPWNLNFKKGAETAGEWNLPGAAANPLFGLPEIPPGDLPAEPFRHLSWFTRKEAEVFFGRDYEIRQLYDRITEPAGDPIVLLYGQSGVGKSSLLDAGITPRLENSHHVIYVRRDPQLGLLGTMALGLGSKDTSFDLGDTWRSLEKPAKPLLLILDQVEELFTRPSNNPAVELEEFLRALVETFAIQANRPQGRLILGFRKEWVSEIEQKLNEHNLPHSKVFLDPLKREDIIQAVTSLTKNDRLQAKYGLTISDGLPAIIADDLSSDPSSPIAPTLQILLTKLWAEAKKTANSQPTFDLDLYRKLQRQGILLSDFLDQQLSALQDSQPQLVQSGLALDVLAYHTTPLGTAEQRTEKDVSGEYHHQVKALPALLEKLKTLYLLADPPQDARDSTNATRLAHDTLAPLIRAKFSHSVMPGQRARRILENRNVEWKNNQVGAPLDSRDLSSVETGLSGMRSLLPEENRLLEASRIARDRKEFRSKILRAAGLVAVLAILLSAGLAWRLSVKAESARQQALARQLAAQANSLGNGPTRFLAQRVLLGIEAATRFESADTVGALREPLARLPTLITARTDSHTKVERSSTSDMEDEEDTESHHIRLIEFSPDRRTLAIADANKVTLWDFATNSVVAQLQGEEQINSIRFSRDGRYMAYGSGVFTRKRSNVSTGFVNTSTKGVVVVWDCVERRQIAKHVFRTAVKQLGFVQNEPLLTMADMWTAKTMSLDGKQEKASWKTTEPDIQKVIRTALSADGRYLAVGTYPVMKIYDVLSGRDISSLRVEEDDKRGFYISELTFSPDGTRLLTYSARIARVWEWRTGKEVSRSVYSDLGSLSHLRISPDNQYVAGFQGFDEELIIWNVADGKSHIEPIKRSEFLEGRYYTKLIFSPDSRFIAVSQGDQTARVFRLPEMRANDEESAIASENGSRVNLIEAARIAPEAMITDIVYHPDGNYLATADENGQTAIWNLEGCFDAGTMPGVEFIYYDPKARYMVRREKSVIRVFRLSDKSQVARFLAGEKDLVAFSSDGSHLAFVKAVGDGVVITELSSGKVVREIDTTDLSRFALSSDGSRLLVLELAKPLKEFAVDSGRLIKEHANLNGLGGSGITSNGRYFVSGLEVVRYDNGEESSEPSPPLIIWDIESGEKVATIPGPVTNIVANANNDYFVIVPDSTNLIIWDVKHRRELRRLSAPFEISDHTISDDGKYVAARATSGPGVIVWNVMTGQPSVLTHHSGFMHFVSFGYDSSWLVTTLASKVGDSASQVDVWHLPAGEITTSLRVDGGVSQAFFAPGDQILILIGEYFYNSDNWFARQVFRKKDDLIKEACKRVGRNLTQKEWQQYLSTEPYRQTCANLPPGV